MYQVACFVKNWSYQCSHHARHERFINAGGIILEIGSALQHGAVVAREYGIPCASGLDGATDKLKDGQMVEVDGSNGIVRILEQGA